MPGTDEFGATNAVLRAHGLSTVCEEAHCPNIGECYGHSTATFMILGSVCTRACRFCAVTQANPNALPPDEDEPERLAAAVRDLGLKHVVITSVSRDDLPDQGAGHFARCVTAIRGASERVKIEVLIPDFRGDEPCLRKVMDSPINVLNHNMETVPRLYREMRRGARYWRSLLLLARAKKLQPDVRTKTGVMLGMGESEEEVRRVMCDLREARVDILTFGQYLQPSETQVEVVRYVAPEEFDAWRDTGLSMGFRHVEAGPLVRSSYHAWKHWGN